MKMMELIMWVGQFGFSIIFPVLVFLMLGNWLRLKFGIGMWVMAVFGILGVLTSISTTRSCLKSIQKAAEEAGSKKKPPTAFNDHS